MFATIRKYRVKDPQLLTKRVNDGFATFTRPPGFLAYYAIETGQGEWASFTIYETEEQAKAHLREATAWVSEHVAPIVEGAPEVFEGPLVVQQEFRSS